MASSSVLLLQLLLVSQASASHFFGGTTTYNYKGRNPDGTFKVDVRHRDTFDGCQFFLFWGCSLGGCGYVQRSVRGEIESSRNAPLFNSQWCETETISRRILQSNKPFQLSADSCCWIPKRTGNNAGWNLRTTVDLGIRSDTGEPNRSPAAAVLPFLRVPQNCPRTYKLMSFDPDGDKVRCRYGNFQNGECSTCHQPSGFHLDQGTCTLHYQWSSANSRVYGFELVVEDFPVGSINLNYSDGSQSSRTPLLVRRKRAANPWWLHQSTTAAPTTNPWWLHQSTTAAPTTNPWYRTTGTHLHATSPPLSKLPLQFSFLVDPPVPSCSEGHYLPKLVDPTPDNGAMVQAEVNREVEIRVKAVAAYSKIHDILVSGPLNITTQRNTDGEFVIRWTPIQDDLGDFFSICFAVESVAGSHGTTPNYYNTPSPQAGVYQTEMRCVVVEVKTKLVETNVICTESTMTVELEKASFPGHQADHLRLNDAGNTACRLKSNTTHIFAVIPLNDCGTDIEEDDINLRFKNAITTFDNPADVITRKHLLEVDFYCQYPKRGNVTQVFTAHRPKVEAWDKGFGTFTYQFEFYPNDQYRAALDPSTYPLVYVLGKRIYMQIEATSSINNTVLFVESCRATPYDNQNYQQTYSIIENGCNVDQTVKIHSTSHQGQFRFCMEAFKFIGSHDQVYISCTVLMCEAGRPGTRCSQGCINSTVQSSWPQGHHHRKREVIAQGQRHFVSQGPLRLGRSAEVKESPALQLNLNLVFIAGCLLAAVGMICAVALYKTKGARVTYQPLSTFES